MATLASATIPRNACSIWSVVGLCSMSKAFDHDNKLFDCLFGKSGGIGASRERLKDLAGQLAKIWRRKASGPKEQQQAQLKQRPVKTFTNAVKQAHETDEARAQAWSNASNQSPGHLGIPPYTLLVLGHPIQGDCLTWMLVHIAIMAWASWAPAARNS
eukprot:1161131-Pelagomonas_calceolata.AAC.2